MFAVDVLDGHYSISCITMLAKYKLNRHFKYVSNE